MTTDICKESELYKYLALNDTIHDFGKGADRGVNIDYIVKGILDKAPYKDYTPFGDNRNITISSFERSVEEFILYNCNLPGIPESILAQSPYLTSPTLGVTGDPDVNKVPIYRFINKNKNVNYGIRLYSYQVLGLTDTQRKNIFEEPSNIDPEISFFSTIIIEDQIPDDTGIRKLFNWTQDELIKDTNITKYLSSTEGVNDIKKNKIGDFLINTFFYAGSGSGYKGFIYNTDAVGGNLRCAFSEFRNNVLGGVKDTTNYGDSAGTEETGGDDDDGTSKNKTVKKCGKNKKTKAENNLFDLVVGFFNVEQKKKGVLSIEVSENPDELPSLFPASNGLPQGRKVYFFSNNLFTKENFTIAYVENKDKTWKPYFQPYNFSLCVYKGKKTDEFTKTIQQNPDDVNILIGQAPFSSGDNGPSVVYLKDLIIAIHRSIDKTSLDRNINNVFPDGKVLNINKMLQVMYNNISETPAVKKNMLLIKFLLDLKRCGDYEQVDAIRMIQDQNEGTNNRFGLQDILFTTGDRLCSLYSRFKKTNVQFFVAGTQRYYLYRQPYIYPSNEVRNKIAQQNIFNELKQKAEKAGNFMRKIKELKYIDLDTYYSENVHLASINKQPNSYIKSLCIYIYTLQRNRLKLLQDIQGDKSSLKTKINFCEKLRGLSFNDTRDPNSPFYFDVGETILKIKYKGRLDPVNCNEVINSFYFLASSEIFSRMRTTEDKFLPMKITKGIDIEKVIPEKKTISLLDFLPEDGKIRNKLDKYYENFERVYDLILRTSENIETTGTVRVSKTNVIDYLKYSNIVICFLQVCILIFGSLDKINEKINNLENVNDTLKPLLIREFEQNRKTSLAVLKTSTGNVDTTPTTPLEEEEELFTPSEEEEFTPSDDIFSSIFKNLKSDKTVNAIVVKKEKINKTKQEIRKEKQEKQEKKQTAKDNKEKKKMVRAVEKFKELKGNTQALKGKGQQNMARREEIVRRRGGRPLVKGLDKLGGGNTQKGGGDIDTLMGDKMEELYTDVNIIAFMNQIYSNIMPYELLLILLTEFNFEYSGISDAEGNMVPLSQLPTDLEEISPNLYPMVLSRGEYLLKFQTELSNLISNPNIGLSEENKIILEKFTKVSVSLVTEATEDEDAKYNTAELEKVLVNDEFTIIPSLEEMTDKVLAKKNVPCFLDKMNKDVETNDLINNYLSSMSNVWLTILKNLSESERTEKTDLNTFQNKIFDITETGVLPSSRDRGSAEGSNIPSPAVKTSLQNIHLITTLLTIDLSGGSCSLQNPFPVTDLSMNEYFTELKTELELNNICKSTSTSLQRSSSLFDIKKIVKKLFILQEKSEINIRILIIYLLTIIGAILFDVTELYFPNFINEENQTNLLTIIGGRDSRRSILVTNEDIMKNISLVIENILSNIPTQTCEAAAGEMGGGRKTVKSKRNKKKNKRKTVKSKNQIYF